MYGTGEPWHVTWAHTWGPGQAAINHTQARARQAGRQQGRHRLGRHAKSMPYMGRSCRTNKWEAW